MKADKRNPLSCSSHAKNRKAYQGESPGKFNQ